MDLTIINQNGQRVLTTAQLAESYGSTPDKISYNFKYNEKRYKEGKHYFLLTGEELKAFKNTNREFQGSVNRLYLWTEKGAWLHAKSLNTDLAWDAYEMLVDEYYRLKETPQIKFSYMIEDPIERAKAWIKEQEEKKLLELANSQKDQIIGELKPKADYTDTILKNKGLVTMTQIAKDYGMSAQEMNDLLHELKIQYKQSGQWLLYSNHHNKGYTHSETINIVRSCGRPDVKMNTKWTQKGRLFIYDLLKSKKNILPIIEREVQPC